MINSILESDLDRMGLDISASGNFGNGTVVVTGCAGFLGFYTLQLLVKRAKLLKINKVIGLDTFLLQKPSWLEELAKKYSNILSLHSFDVSKDNLADIEGCDTASYVIHGASIASPIFYRQYPIETVDANIWGLRKLLEFYQNSDSLKGLLFYSSSEIYGDPIPTEIPTSEEYRGNVSCAGPRACYDEAKRFGETLCWIYSNQFDMPITVVRPFNNYGPGMGLKDKRLPADLAQCVVTNEDIILYSDGTPTRTFCYVSDAVTGYMLSLLYGKHDVFNIGIDKPEIMIRDLAKIYQETAKDVFGYSGKVIYQTSSDAAYLEDNPNRRCPVIVKAQETLGYNPSILVEEGVRRYLEFLKIESAAA